MNDGPPPAARRPPRPRLRLRPRPRPRPGILPARAPLAALTTFELRDHRRELERAIAFFGRQDPVPPARRDLQARLDDVIAEQDERARPARA